MVTILGSLLTLTGLGLTLDRSYHLEMQARQQEVQHVAETMASLLHGLVEQEQGGTLSRDAAQKSAADILRNAHYDGTNYFFAYRFDGVAVAHPLPKNIGKDLSAAVDSNGFAYVKAFTETGRTSGRGFVRYSYPKPGSPDPQPKIAFVAAIPEWQWVVGTGLYLDDVRQTLIGDGTRLALIFTPLLLGFVALAAFTQRSISTLLNGAAAAMRRLAQGELDTAIVGLGRKDAIGEMAASVAVFKEASSAKMRLEQEAAEQRALIETQRNRTEAETAKAAEELNRTVALLGTGLARLADGDLQHQLEDRFTGDYKLLRDNFNATARSMCDTLAVIANKTSSMRSGADDITYVSDDLARRVEQQAASLAQTATALGGITEMVRKTADGAADAHNLVTTAHGDAEQSAVVVKQAVEAMTAIEHSSNEIGKIIGVIDEIAFQTNLLALNAGVEAARAGDSGRGFAVVASEVRALAQRSALAAKEIKSLISVSANQVTAGVRMVGETGSALGRIMTQVGRINEVVIQIAASAREQATGLQDVNKAVGDMDQVTRKNAAMVEQSNASVRDLVSDTVELAELLAHFKLTPSDTASSATAMSPSAARAA